jgi:hypothetical protein
MSKSTNICPHCQLISTTILVFHPLSLTIYAQNSHCRILNIVRGIQPYHSSQEGPCSKCATTQCSDVLGGCRRRIDGCGVVHTRRESESTVGLNGVTDGDQGGLHGVGLVASREVLQGLYRTRRSHFGSRPGVDGIKDARIDAMMSSCND